MSIILQSIEALRGARSRYDPFAENTENTGSCSASTMKDLCTEAAFHFYRGPHPERIHQFLDFWMKIDESIPTGEIRFFRNGQEVARVHGLGVPQ